MTANLTHKKSSGLEKPSAPQFNMSNNSSKSAPLQKESHLDDLHTALRSCNEIGSAKTLAAFLIDIQKLSHGKLP